MGAGSRRYWFAQRSADAVHGYQILVFDTRDQISIPLTLFAREALRAKAPGTASAYLHAILPFHAFLETDPWQQRARRCWDGPPEQVRLAVADYQRVTSYYGQAPPAMVQERMDGFLSRFATYVNLGEVVARAPEEIQQQLEAAQGRIGTLANVKGGRCVQPGFCPAKSACIGCPCKAPEPTKRADVKQEHAWATAQREMAVCDGRTLDLHRMEQVMRDCETELQEMDLIEAWRRDETRESRLQAEDIVDEAFGTFIPFNLL